MDYFISAIAPNAEWNIYRITQNFRPCVMTSLTITEILSPNVMLTWLLYDKRDCIGVSGALQWRDPGMFYFWKTTMADYVISFLWYTLCNKISANILETRLSPNTTNCKSTHFQNTLLEAVPKYRWIVGSYNLFYQLSCSLNDCIAKDQWTSLQFYV